MRILKSQSLHRSHALDTATCSIFLSGNASAPTDLFFFFFLFRYFAVFAPGCLEEISLLDKVLTEEIFRDKSFSETLCSCLSLFHGYPRSLYMYTIFFLVFLRHFRNFTTFPKPYCVCFRSNFASTAFCLQHCFSIFSYCCRNKF